MWTENPALYEVARQVCHEAGLDWTDPRTGETYKAPRKALVGQRARSKRAHRGSTPRPSANSGRAK